MGGMDAELAMATTQPLTPSASNSSISGGRGGIKIDSTPSDSFPAGLRVLVVDDDPICLLILDRMLRRCMYQVTTCGKATAALEMLRENKSGFDLVISDVCMPDMDGFKLLELVGLEMDLPVIMMSANGETSAVMKGIKHGACDYLLKPVRIEELRNIWQHVVRKRWRAAASHEDDKHKRVADDADYSSSANEGSDGVWKQSKKRKDSKEDEDDADNDNDDPSSTTKKPRVVWSVDLHQQFVAAVNQLGIDKAVPKRILELMNVQGLTRENVASHLQKYRLYLKRISGVAHQPGGLNSSFAGSPDSNFGAVGASGLGGLGDLRSLAATGQLSPETLMSTLQAGLLGRLGPSNNFGVGNVDHSLLLQVAALQGANSGPLTRPSYGQSVLGNQGNLQAGSPDLKQLTQSSQQRVAFGQMADKGQTGMPSLQQQKQQQQQLAAAVGLGGMAQLVGMNSNLQVDPNNSALMMQALQQQAGGHSTNGGGLSLPTRGALGQHGLLTEIGAWASSPSNVNSVNAGIGTGVAIQNACSLKPGSVATLVGTGSSSPNILGALGRSSGVDSKGLQIPSMGHGNLSLPSPVVSSPSAGIGLDSDLTAARMKNIGSSIGVSSEGSLQTPGSFGSNFTSLSGMKHGQGLHVGQRNRTGWQGPGLSQEFGQGNSPVLSPRYSQASSISQGLIMSSGQEQGQLCSPGFNMGFPGNLSLDGGRLKACLGNTSSQSELSTAESDLKVKEESLSLLMGVKAERGLLPVPLSDDLLNVLLKQQQDGLGLTEEELSSADGYASNNMYVK